MIRSSVLRNTPLIDNYVGSDLTLLGELGLNGNVRDIDSVMFWRREHNETSTTGKYKPRRKRLNWFDTSKKSKGCFSRMAIEHGDVRSVARQDLPFSNKVSCGGAILGRMWSKKRYLVEDILYAVKDLVKSWI